MVWKLYFVMLCIVCQVKTQDQCSVGEFCFQDYKYGTCQLVRDCMSNGRQWWKYKIRGYIGYEPIVCCVPLPAAPTTTTAPPPVATTTRPSYKITTTEYVPETYDYVTNDDTNRVGADGPKLDEDGCTPLDSSWTVEKNGRKAWDKCIEYQRKLVYPCEPSYALMGGMERRWNCHHEADELIVGGVEAARNEFPHMALLGYGRTINGSDWKCGGTLISDRFILTAGHCTSSRSPVMYVIVGPYKRTDDVSSSQVYRISRIIKHPNYQALSKQNDIALLETDRTIVLDHTVVPACLDVFGENISRAVATGWGATEYIGRFSDTLQKVTLTRFPEGECHSQYPRNRHMMRYDGSTQMCYGDHEGEKDTCQGDSGGPLTIYNNKVKCMYTVVGVTSFGKRCGDRGVPGWYTKVAPYVPWIERIVWP